jgi:hypothetical protein
MPTYIDPVSGEVIEEPEGPPPPSLVNPYVNMPMRPPTSDQQWLVDNPGGEVVQAELPPGYSNEMGAPPEMMGIKQAPQAKLGKWSGILPLLIGGVGLALSGKHKNLGAALGGFAKGFADSRHQQLMKTREKDFEMEQFQVKEAHDLVGELEGFNLDKLVGKAPRGILEGIQTLSQKYNEALTNDGGEGPGKVSAKEATTLLGYAAPLRSYIKDFKAAEEMERVKMIGDEKTAQALSMETAIRGLGVSPTDQAAIAGRGQVSAEDNARALEVARINANKPQRPHRPPNPPDPVAQAVKVGKYLKEVGFIPGTPEFIEAFKQGMRGEPITVSPPNKRRGGPSIPVGTTQDGRSVTYNGVPVQ